MKRINEEMLNKIKVITISGSLLLFLYFGLEHFDKGYYFIKKLIAILMPFISGFALAFILEPLCQSIKKLLRKKLSENLSKNLAVCLTIIIFLLILVLFFIVIIPQLVNSIINIGDIINSELSNIDEILKSLSITIGLDFSELEKLIEYFGISSYLKNILTYLGDFLPGILESSFKVVSTLFSLIIGVIICVYLLLDKERFYKQVKATLYAFLPKEKVLYLIEISHLSSKMFKSFFVGKTIDSFAIGVICYVCMEIFGFEYPLLISFIIGITNIIPVFGPFFGAIPSVIILLFVDPIETFWFAIFVLALQQFDGNILGPYILGDSIGLPTFWVMFAIIVGGGLFGVLGMFIGIPLFAVIYFIIKAVVYKRLETRNIKI